MRKKRSPLRRLRTKLHNFKDGALECIREYPVIRRERSHRFMDSITIVCVLAVSAVTIMFTFIN